MAKRKRPATTPATPTPETPGYALYAGALITLAVVAMVLCILAFGPLKSTWWGFHLFAFLPRFVAPLCWTFLAVGGIVAFREPEIVSRLLDPLGRRPVVSTLALTAVATLLFWWFRSGQIILGDGIPLTIDMPLGNQWHPRQPITMWLQERLYAGTHKWFEDPSLDPPQVAKRTIAMGSIVLGALFVPVAVWLGHAVTGNEKKSASGWLATLLILSQGYALLFFGYIENYTFYLFFVGLYLLLAVRWLRGRGSLWLCALVVVVATGLHLSSLSLYPSFILLLVVGAVRREKRIDAILGLVVFVAGLFVLNWVTGRMSEGFNLIKGWRDMQNTARTSQGGGAGLKYVFSLLHLRDFFNEQYLMGPLSAFLYVFAVLVALIRRTLRSVEAWFLVASGAMFLAGSFYMSEPLLGYPRDWDLFAPAGITYTVAGVYLVMQHVRAERGRVAVLTFAVVMSLAHLVPWVWINHSEARTIARFEHCPLGYGRTEVVLGNYYLRHNDRATAEVWFKKALDVNLYNATAYAFLGKMYREDERYEEAANMYERAVILRQDKEQFRAHFIDVLLKLRRCEDAAPHLAWLAKRAPNRVGYWHVMSDSMIAQGCEDKLPHILEPVLAFLTRTHKEDPYAAAPLVNRGIVLRRMGRMDEAIADFEMALKLEPNSIPALFNAGSAYIKAGRYDEGIKTLERFLLLAPNHALAAETRKTLEAVRAQAAGSKP